MRTLLFALLLLAPVALTLPTPTATAQEVGARYRVVLVDATVLVGTLVSITANEVVLEDERGLRTTIPRARIHSLDVFEGGFSQADPNYTRLLLFPTARSLPARAGRFGIYSIFFPTVALGITDRVDVSVGSTIPVAGFTLINVNAKVTPVQTERLALAVGASAFIPFVEGEETVVGGTFYGIATIGSREQAFTIGGIGAYGTDFDDATVGDGGALVLGFEKQLSNNVKFISENYLIITEKVSTDVPWSNGALLSAGVRFFGDRLSADIAPVVAVGDGKVQFIPIPYFTFSYAFENR